MKFRTITGTNDQLENGNLNEDIETKMLAPILKHPLDKTHRVLSHPVVQVFVNAKFDKYKWIFVASQLLHASGKYNYT